MPGHDTVICQVCKALVPVHMNGDDGEGRDGLVIAVRQLIAQLAQQSPLSSLVPAVPGPSIPAAVGMAGYPNAGGRRTCGGGGLVLDLLRNTSISQDRPAAFNQEPIIPGLKTLLGMFNSVFLVADDDLTVTPKPGQGSFHLDACAYHAIPIVGLEQLTLDSSGPFNFWAVFSTLLTPPQSYPIAFHQERFGLQTIAKTAAAGTADSFTDVTFYASDAGTQLSAGGTTVLHTGAIGQRVVIVENDGAGNVAINVNIQGRGVAGRGWVDDPATGASKLLAASDLGLYVVERHYHQMRVRVRVDAALAAAQDSDLVIQYRGFSPGLG